jgi:hypothetical protein
MSFPVRPFLFGSCLCGTGNRRRRNKMKDKNLKFCMDQLRSLQDRDGLEPGRRSELEKAMEALKGLWRKQNPSRKEIYVAVRLVAEAILTTFKK